MLLQNNLSLKNKINELWDKFWSGGISNPLTAIEQITYLLFMKKLDDLDSKKKANAREKYISKFDGKFILPGSNVEIDKHTLRWSHFKKMSSKKRLDHVRNKVFPFLKQLNGVLVHRELDRCKI